MGLSAHFNTGTNEWQGKFNITATLSTQVEVTCSCAYRQDAWASLWRKAHLDQPIPPSTPKLPEGMMGVGIMMIGGEKAKLNIIKAEKDGSAFDYARTGTPSSSNDVWLHYFLMIVRKNDAPLFSNLNPPKSAVSIPVRLKKMVRVEGIEPPTFSV